jgi:predicted metal-dependent hydrolase
MSSSASGMKAAKLLAKAAKLGGKAAFKKAAAGELPGGFRAQPVWYSPSRHTWHQGMLHRVQTYFNSSSGC